MRRGVTAIVLLTCGVAAADELPAPAHVAVALDHGRARFVATWQWRAAAGVHGVRIELPAHALATDARLRIGGEAHELALVDSDRARTALGRTWSAPRRSKPAGAIEIAADGDALVVELLMPATGDVELAIDVDAPTCFAGDVRYAAVPADWPLATVETRAVGGCAPKDPWSASTTGRWVALPTDEAAALPHDRIAVGAGAMVAGDRQIARIEVALAAELATIPDDLQTVFVIDRSRSLTPYAQTAESALLGAYGERVPHSQLAVVTFDREARVIAPWGPADSVAPVVRAQLDRSELANGSELVRGIAAAGELLAHVHGTRRVIVLTDDVFATRISPARIAAAAHLVPPGTIVHTVLVHGNGALWREDVTDLAPLAAATEGEAFELGGSGPLDATVLAMPIELDRVQLRLTDPVAGWTALEDTPFALPTLAAGHGMTWWATGRTAPRTPSFVTIEGLLWNRAWHATVPLPHADRDVARAVLEGVRDAKTREAALDLAHAVDDNWSLYARWGGDGGYPEDGIEGGIVGGTVCGCDASHINAPPPPPPPPPPPTTEPSLETQLRTAIAGCALDGASGSLRVETTEDEIVDVAVSLRGDRAVALRCIETAVWAARVHVPGTPRHATVTIALSAPAPRAARSARASAASR